MALSLRWLKLVELLSEAFGRLESDGVGSGDFDLLAGRGVGANAGGAALLLSKS